jgi:chitinase
MDLPAATPILIGRSSNLSLTVLTLMLALGLAAGSAPTPAHAAPGAPASAAATSLGPDHRVVGYFPIWIRNSGYTERDIDFGVVNQIAHFSVEPRADGGITIPDWGPFPDPELIAAAHASGARIALVVGGDHAEATRAFAALAARPESRTRFVREALAMIEREGYDGLDLDWEFPASAQDRASLTALVRELRAALGQARTLSLAGPSSDWYGRWYDFPALSPLLDWVGAMTYNINAPGWSPATGHNAPLYAARGEASVDASRAYYLGRGVPAEKLLLGLPFYGQRFDGASDLGQPFPANAGAAVDYQDVAGLLDSADWQPKRDATARTPYLVKRSGGALISYDDPESITAKCRYATEQGMGGVIIWHLGRDRVGSSQPLLQAVRECRYGGSAPGD